MLSCIIRLLFNAVIIYISSLPYLYLTTLSLLLLNCFELLLLILSLLARLYSLMVNTRDY